MNGCKRQTQMQKQDNRLQIKEAQEHCYNVIGRMLNAAENYSKLFKKEKINQKKEVFGYYNSFRFSHNPKIEETKSLMIEFMDIYANMRKRFRKSFGLELSIPIKENYLNSLFFDWTNGLDEKNKVVYNSMYCLLTNSNDEDCKKVVDNYYKKVSQNKDQVNGIDPKIYMKYFPMIQYAVEKKSKELKNKFEENRDYELKKHLNKDYMDNTLNRKYDKKKEEKNSQNKENEAKNVGEYSVSKVNEFNRECFKNNNNLKKEIESSKKNKDNQLMLLKVTRKLEII